MQINFNLKRPIYYKPTLLHIGQVSLDFSCPWNKSTITESFLLLYLLHASLATSTSGLPAPSTSSTYGFSLILFRSWVYKVILMLNYRNLSFPSKWESVQQADFFQISCLQHSSPTLYFCLTNLTTKQTPAYMYLNPTMSSHSPQQDISTCKSTWKNLCAGQTEVLVAVTQGFVLHVGQTTQPRQNCDKWFTHFQVVLYMWEKHIHVHVIIGVQLYFSFAVVGGSNFWHNVSTRKLRGISWINYNNLPRFYNSCTMYRRTCTCTCV